MVTNVTFIIFFARIIAPRRNKEVNAFFRTVITTRTKWKRIASRPVKLTPMQKFIVIFASEQKKRSNRASIILLLLSGSATACLMQQQANQIFYPQTCLEVVLLLLLGLLLVAVPNTLILFGVCALKALEDLRTCRHPRL
jgi:hypothetical protein